MTLIDVNTFLGRYPWRDTGESTGADLRREMLRMGIGEAWVSNLTAMYWRDPAAGNRELYRAQQRDAALRPVPAIHPGLPAWSLVLEEAVAMGAPAVRCDAGCQGLAPSGPEVRELFAACAARGVPLMMAVRLEDVRQRHPHDVSVDLTAADVRTLMRSNPEGRLIITHADRDFIEQVHFGSTPAEAERLLWDICWIWGPPEDHLELLLETVGIARFTFGTGMPLRLPETSVARLDLLNLDAAARQRISSGNLHAFTSAGQRPPVEPEVRA